MPKWGEIYISAKGPGAVWFAFVPVWWWLRIKRVLLEQWMPSQCQAAGGKSAFSVAAKGSLVSPNPSSLHIYVGMTVYIRIYKRVPCVCATMPVLCSQRICSLFFICVSLLHFSARPGCKFIFTMCTLMPTYSQPLNGLWRQAMWWQQILVDLPKGNSSDHRLIQCKDRKKKFTGAEIVKCSYY